MLRDMRIFSLIVAGLILLVQLFPARAGVYRTYLCAKLDGHCAMDCLAFEKKIGTCGTDLTPLCCKKRKKH
ncbi:beta-defensin 13-like [Mesocricetus auratus]|uniref:Beta-defensin n=1 Tax=Mesocricetus auratus TaxID=10036 RepID=A0A1U7RHZ7_MESAU|nr:beta-defensin 13-like [Mesocricetus auratus]